MIKKTTLALLSLMCSVSTAGTMGAQCSPGTVTVPCAKTAWDIGLDALYLKSVVDSNVGYVGFTPVNDSRVYNEYKPDWKWGFRLEGSYHFNTGNDFTVNWTHYDASIAKDYTYTLNAEHIALTNNNRWDQVNLEMAQRIHAGSMSYRIHGGLSFLQIKNTPNLLATELSGQYLGTIAFDSKFNGVGVRVGSDAAHVFDNGVTVYAKGAADLFVGQSKFTSSPITTNPLAFAFWHGNKKAVVPALETKLGISYGMNASSGEVTFDLGYQLAHFFNAQHAYLTTVRAIREFDQSFHGVSFGGKWVGNLA